MKKPTQTGFTAICFLALAAVFVALSLSSCLDSTTTYTDAKGRVVTTRTRGADPTVVSAATKAAVDALADRAEKGNVDRNGK